MPLTFGFFSDAGLTQPLTGLQVLQSDDGTYPAANRTIYFGSPVAGKKCQANSNPGVDAIQIAIVDAVPASGVQATHARLATSAGGLSSATPGAALSLGTQRLSGPANALAVYVRVDTPALAAATYTDLSLVVSTLIESDV